MYYNLFFKLSKNLENKTKSSVKISEESFAFLKKQKNIQSSKLSLKIITLKSCFGFKIFTMYNLKNLNRYLLLKKKNHLNCCFKRKKKLIDFFSHFIFFRHCEGCNSATTIPIKISAPPNKSKEDKCSPAKRPTIPAHTGSPA